MSLSDCAKCQDTPCTCGWNYRNYSIERLEKMKRLLEKIVEFKKKFPDINFEDWPSKDARNDDKKFERFINEP